MDSDRKCRALGLQPLKEFRDPAQTLTQLNYLNDGDEGIEVMRADDGAGGPARLSQSREMAEAAELRRPHQIATIKPH